MIEVLKTGALTTVQDLGRHGSLRYGVGTAGAMDPLALASANILLGNDDNAAAIEIQIFPFQVRFTADCAFALTGADCAARLDEQALLPWWVHRAREGQELTLGLPQGGAGTAVRASRAYLALAGGVDVPEVLGSRSTQLRGAFGGHEGRALRPGDVLRAAAADPAACPVGFGVVPPALALKLEVDGVSAVRVLAAAEYVRFSPKSQAAFWNSAWKITSHSDRYGYRLAGEALTLIEPIEMLSHGIVPGVIQVPPGGQPIIQMRDAQPSGGYPKIGTVIEADLWRLGQAPSGSSVRFIETDWETALAARDATQAWLDEARRLADLQRLSPRGNRP
jgi:biotin-dependent carboxylase-like uncharacterized protein